MARCLVVDDSEVIRGIAADILTGLGHDVTEAEDCKGAVTASSGVDVVFLDWDLPAMGALDFLRAAAGMEERPVIILCAAENDPRQFALARAAGAPLHVLKPFDVGTLAAAMRQAGHEAKAGAA
jgi:two-component system chemotaxis response regulator CheY